MHIRLQAILDPRASTRSSRISCCPLFRSALVSVGLILWWVPTYPGDRKITPSIFRAGISRNIIPVTYPSGRRNVSFSVAPAKSQCLLKKLSIYLFERQRVRRGTEGRWEGESSHSLVHSPVSTTAKAEPNHTEARN